MANFASANRAASRADFDAGLRSYMLRVYNYMVSGVLLTGLVALLAVASGFTQAMASSSVLSLIAAFSPLAIVLVLSFGVHRMSNFTAQALFWVYAALVGVSISTVLLVYTGTSVAETFFATAAAFAGLSLYGYTTKRDLGPIGTFLIMGLIGLLVAMIINIFLGSSTMDLVISALGVLIFAGLTAYDTQKIKDGYFDVRGSAFQEKSAIMGALDLYLDFINMFLFLLRFMGDRD
jgi:FtsH-binding integral membrane protein